MGKKGTSKRVKNGKNGLVHLHFCCFFLLFDFPCVFLFFAFFSSLKNIRISYRGGHKPTYTIMDIDDWLLFCFCLEKSKKQNKSKKKQIEKAKKNANGQVHVFPIFSPFCLSFLFPFFPFYFAFVFLGFCWCAFWFFHFFLHFSRFFSS